MSQKENSIHEIRELLAPIKGRPNVEPRQEFVFSLKEKINKQKTRKNPIIIKKPLIAFGSVVMLMIVISLSFLTSIQPENAGVTQDEQFHILSNSQLDVAIKFEYGEGENQIGNNPGRGEGNATSFDVKDGTFYILDTANNRILITDHQGNHRTIPIENPWDLSDILVTEENEIYVLDSAAKKVYQYSQDGKLVKTYDVPDPINIPTGLGFSEENGVTVNQAEGIVASLTTGERIAVNDQLYKAVKVNDMEGKIQLFNNEKESEIRIPFDHSYGGILVHAINEEQIVFTKTEVASNTKILMVESHVYVINKQGETLGAIRIPLEKMIMSPDHIVKTDENKIYLIAPEADYLAIYELKPGVSFEKLLDDRIKAELNLDGENIGFDYKTHGEPYPELEQDIAQLFTSDTIFASYSNKSLLNGVSINEDGTVIVDFKDFHEPGPSTAEKKEIYDTLAETVFKYPDVKKVYFQFDGSFSEWCFWLETVEEPMTSISYDLDMKTREILQLIKNGELDRLEDEYGANFTIAEDNKIIFEEMDIPELAIRPDMLQTMDSMEATTGFEEGNTFNFFYFLYSSEVDTATQIFVQYKKDENGNWVLANIRTNH